MWWIKWCTMFLYHRWHNKFWWEKRFCHYHYSWSWTCGLVSCVAAISSFEQSAAVMHWHHIISAGMLWTLFHSSRTNFSSFLILWGLLALTALPTTSQMLFMGLTSGEWDGQESNSLSTKCGLGGICSIARCYMYIMNHLMVMA